LALNRLDKIEILLIKILMALACGLAFFQYAAAHPRWSQILVLLNHIEGAIYQGGGWP